MGEGSHARQIGLLLVLYVIQAIPLGLSAAMPLVLQTRGASYTSLGKFGLSSLPFSLKLFWAPLVDATRVPGFGRRKSWLVPTQVRLILIRARTILRIEPVCAFHHALGNLRGLVCLK